MFKLFLVSLFGSFLVAAGGMPLSFPVRVRVNTLPVDINIYRPLEMIFPLTEKEIVQQYHRELMDEYPLDAGLGNNNQIEVIEDGEVIDTVDQRGNSISETIEIKEALRKMPHDVPFDPEYLEILKVIESRNNLTYNKISHRDRQWQAVAIVMKDIKDVDERINLIENARSYPFHRKLPPSIAITTRDLAHWQTARAFFLKTIRDELDID